MGWQSSSILKPLLQQGLSDAEEVVICKALAALTCMCQLGLLQKTHVYEFVSDIGSLRSQLETTEEAAPAHPLTLTFDLRSSLLVPPQPVDPLRRRGLHHHHRPAPERGRRLLQTDAPPPPVHQPAHHPGECSTPSLPAPPQLDHHHRHHQQQLRPLIAMSAQIDEELVLLSVLKEPVSRSIFDYALRSRDIASLFRHLLLRQKKRMGSIPECPAPDDPAITQMLKKLLSQVS